jgi:hypothetical protein
MKLKPRKVLTGANSMTATFCSRHISVRYASAVGATCGSTNVSATAVHSSVPGARRNMANSLSWSNRKPDAPMYFRSNRKVWSSEKLRASGWGGG